MFDDHLSVGAEAALQVVPLATALADEETGPGFRIAASGIGFLVSWKLLLA